MPNGTVAPGNVCPSPPVPTIGSAAAYAADGDAAWPVKGKAEASASAHSATDIGRRIRGDAAGMNSLRSID